MKIVAGLLIAVAVLLLGAGIFIYGGIYNVAASKPDLAAWRWALNTAMEHSVRARARTVAAPQEFSDADIARGFRNFSEMCVTCHGAPDKERGEIGEGLNPTPPHLHDLPSQRWNRAELYWIVRNGIRMTGMPAFGETHDERELWSIVAFVERLPGMSAKEYRALEIKNGPARERHGH